MEVRTILLVLPQPKLLRVQDFPSVHALIKNTAQEMKLSIKDFFSKLGIWLHLLKKSLLENFIFCAVKAFSGERDFQFTFIKETQFFCKELAKSNRRPINPKLCGRLQNSILEFFSTSVKKK